MNNTIRTIIMPTDDWSAYQLVEEMNATLQQFEHKPYLWGGDFSAGSREYQIILFSEKQFSEEEVSMYIEEMREQYRLEQDEIEEIE